MPRLNFSTLFTANATIDPIAVANWQYRYVPWPAKVVVCLRSTTAGNRMSLFAGALNLVQESPVPAGGTIGVTPTPFNAPVIEEEVAAGDQLTMPIREVLAGTPTVDGFIDLIPL